MSEDKYYRCIPELNKECKKNNCYINGGECEMTICKKYTLKGLLEEIERLKNREQECIDHYLVQCKYASKMEDKYITANNIINEVREYIKEHPCNTWYYARDDIRELVLCQDELLEIIDKVEE